VLETEQALALRGAVFLSERSVLLSSSENTENALVVWDFISDTTTEIRDEEALRGSAMSVGAVASPDGSIAVCSLDFPADTLPVIELSSGKRLAYPMPVKLGGRVFAFSPDGSMLAGAFNSTVVVWDTNTREVMHVLETGAMDISGLVFSPDGGLLAAASSENVTLFRTASGKLQYTFGELDLQYGFYQFGAAFSPDSSEVIVYGNTAQAYDLADGKPISMFGGRKAISAAYSNDGRYAALVTVEGDSGVFSTAVSATALPSPHAEETQAGLYEHPAWFEMSEQPGILHRTHTYDASIYVLPEQMTNSPSGRFIAVTYPDGYVEVWDLNKKDAKSVSVYVLCEHYSAIMQTRMTDRFLLTAGFDGRIMVFDLITGATRYFFSVGERIPRFEVSKDGGMIIALAESCSYAQVYDLVSGRLIYTLEAHAEDSIENIGFTEDGASAVIVLESGKAISGRLFKDFDDLLEYSFTVDGR